MIFTSYSETWKIKFPGEESFYTFKKLWQNESLKMVFFTVVFRQKEFEMSFIEGKGVEFWTGIGTVEVENWLVKVYYISFAVY